MSVTAEHFNEHHHDHEDDERGPLLAGAAVALTTAVLLILTRFSDKWAAGVEFLVSGVAAALVLALVFRTPGGRGRVWGSTLLAAAFVLTLLALITLADMLGANGDDLATGTVAWITAILTLAWGALAVLRRSGLATLLAAASAVVCLLTTVDLIFDLESATTVRYLLLLCIVLLVAGAFVLAERRTADRRPAVGDDRPGREHVGHATALADVAGLAAIAIALTFAANAVVGLFGAFGGEEAESIDIAWGWDLVVLGTAIALIAFALRHRVAGPGWIAATAILAFILMNASSDDPSLIGWPIVLLLVTAALAALALRGGLPGAGTRGRRPTPSPEPPVAASVAPPAGSSGVPGDLGESRDPRDPRDPLV